MRPFWKDRRRRLLIDRLQVRLIISGLTTVALGVGLALLAIFGPPILVLFDPNATPDATARASEQFLTLHHRVWLGLLLVLAVSVHRSLITSHRVAGALYRLRDVLDRARRGDLTTRAVIRKNDYLHREADAVNATLEALDEQLSEIRSRSRELRSAAEALRSGPPDPAAIDGLVERAKSIAQRLDAFELTHSPDATTVGSSAAMDAEDGVAV